MLDAAPFATNATFNSGDEGWTMSDETQVQVVTDADSEDGAYLRLQGHSQWAASSSFMVPSEAQSLRFRYQAWTTRNAGEQVPLIVQVLSGSDFSTSIDIGTVHGSTNDEWKTAVLDVQAFQGKTIKLRLRTDWWDGNRNGQARIDSLSLNTETPDWTSSNASQVQIVNDTDKVDGNYLRLYGHSQWAASSSFVVPSEAQSLRFRYQAWTTRNAGEQVPLIIQALSGSDFSTSTDIGTVHGSTNDGWKTAVLDLQAFQGKTIKLRLRTDWWDGNRNGQARIDSLSLNTETPDWTSSNASFVNISDETAPVDPGVSTPKDMTFNSGVTGLDVSSSPANDAFARGRQSLDPTTYPINHSFDTGDQEAWTTSSGTSVQVVTDGNSEDGAYLRLQGYSQWAASSSFVVPSEAQSLRFRYQAWTTRNAGEQVPLIIQVLSGSDFSTSTDIGTVHGSTNDGWKTAVLDLQAFQGKTIKLRLRTDWWDGNRNGQARIDSLSLNTETPDWTPSNASQVQIVNDTDSVNGNYLRLYGHSQWAASSSFTVPSEAQSLRFRYQAWTTRNAGEQVPLIVQVLSGSDFSTNTDIGTVQGSTNDGWKTAVLDLQAFQGKTIKLRLRTDWWDGNRNGQARIDSLSLNTETPGWTPSDARTVNISDETAPVNPGVSTPGNMAFDAASVTLPMQSYPINSAFGAGRRALTTTTYPINYDFSQNLAGWATSDTSMVTTVDDANSDDGAYLRLYGHSQWAASSSFTVPSEAQSLRFRYQAWTTRNAGEQVPLIVQVLSGSDFSTNTDIGTVQGSTNDGWKTAVLDLQAFQGKTIKLRLRTDWWDGNRNGQARIDSLSLNTETPDWTPSNASQVQIVNDTDSVNGNYLRLYGHSQWAASSSFVVPSEAQSLRFRYQAWTTRNAGEQVPLIVQVLSGSDFSTNTDIGTVQGSTNDGWKTAVLDLQAFQGKTIKLRLRTDWWDGNRNGQARIDSLSLNTETPDWTPSNASQVQIVNDTDSVNGNYLRLYGHSQWAASNAFLVPLNVENVRFQYQAWTERNAGEQVPLIVQVLSGPNFSVSTDIGTVQGSASEGWKDASLGLSAFRGRVVKLRLRTDWWDGNRNGQARIDSLSLPTGSSTSTAPNTTNPDHGYLRLNGHSQWAASNAFLVPLNVENVRFQYQAWTERNAGEQVPLIVQVLSGPNFSVSTDIGTVQGSASEGWKDASLGLSAFRGRVVKLRLRTDWWDGNRNGKATIDVLSFDTGTDGTPIGSDRTSGCAYLYLRQVNTTATSSDFVVSSAKQQLSFDFQAWTERNANEQVPLIIEVLHGENYATATSLVTLNGSALQGWQSASLDLSAYVDQSIKLRFRTDWWDGNRNGKAKIDNIGGSAVGSCTAGQLSTSITKPDNIPSGEVGTFRIDYKNTSNVDMDVPLFQLISRGGSPIALDEAGLDRGGTMLHLLLQVAGAPLDKLPAGASGSITIYTKATASLDFALTPVPLDAPIPWDTLKADYEPADADQAQFDAYWDALRAQLGQTGRELRANLLAMQKALTSFKGSTATLTEVYDTADMQAEEGAKSGIALWSFQDQSRSFQQFSKQLVVVSDGCPPVLSSMVDPGEVNLHLIQPDPGNLLSNPRFVLPIPDGRPTLSQDTYIVVHGWNNGGGRNIDGNAQWESQPEEWIQLTAAGIKQAYPNANVVIVDWKDGAYTRGNLVEAAYNTHFTGLKIAEQVRAWGINPSRLHLIGHSLGAQVSSFASDYIECFGLGKVKHITGLDPAGPGFANEVVDDPRVTGPFAGYGGRIDAGDATFVDVYNTSHAGGGGSGQSNFTVIRRENKLWAQPGCRTSVCSHSYAHQLYAASLRCNDEGFSPVTTDGVLVGWYTPSQTGIHHYVYNPVVTGENLNNCSNVTAQSINVDNIITTVYYTIPEAPVSPPLPHDIMTADVFSSNSTSEAVMIGVVQPNVWLLWPNAESESNSGSKHPFTAWTIAP